jgi:phosphoadenosine phosphosulfate reductase
MRSPFLGKIPLHWCDACHVPVLGNRCACGTDTREVPVTPPGDIRPAFPYDIDVVNQIYLEHFGAPLIPKGHLALLNKVPDKDRMDEIVVGGAVVGAIRYIPKEARWEPIPRRAAAALMTPHQRLLVVDEDAVESIQGGASVLAPCLISIDDLVREGDEVIIYSQSGICAGVGRARVDAVTARKMERGMIVRIRKNTPCYCVPGPSDWSTAVQANEPILSTYEGQAIRFVQQVTEQHPDLTPTVSFSGGKDSLATLILVLKAIGAVPLIFADSGFEFPETTAHIEEVASRYGLEVARTGNNGRFWNIFEEKGPPAMNRRWCCSVCKLDPVHHTIIERWGACLSFIGQRKYESFKRMATGKIWRNRKVPSQLACAPIQQWSALHVWLYLFREQATYNPLYEAGFDRVGCYICPSSDLATMGRIAAYAPALWDAWKERLEGWAREHGYPADWVHRGEWRTIQGER